MIELEVTVDAFNGSITKDLTIKSKKGDKLIVSKEAWNVIQAKYGKWFKFIQEIKESPEVKEVVEVPYNKMMPSRYKNK